MNKKLALALVAGIAFVAALTFSLAHSQDTLSAPSSVIATTTVVIPTPPPGAVWFEWDKSRQCGQEEWLWSDPEIEEQTYTPVYLEVPADSFRYRCQVFPSVGASEKVSGTVPFVTQSIYLFDEEIEGTRQALILALEPGVSQNQVHIYKVGTLDYGLGCRWEWQVWCSWFMPCVSRD